jgi:hypothetical protein
MIDKLVPREFKSDQDERLTPPTAFIDALNITVDTDNDGNSGVVKNVKGTSVVTDATGIDYSGETIEVIGTCRDNERGRTYIFVYCGTSSKNAILQYEDERNELTTVLSDSTLTFSSNSWVSSSVVNGNFRSDGTRSILYFTDDINEPRKIDIDAKDEFVNDGLSASQRISKLSVMKSLGVRPPTAKFYYDPDIGYSNFRKGSFQFALQYIYKDGEVSSISPYSKYVYLKERHDSSLPTSKYPNVCSITLPYFTIDKDLLKIRLLFRENNGAEVSPFRIIEEFNPRSSISRNVGDVANFSVFEAYSNVYRFINDGYAGIVPSTQEDNPFSAVPRRAKNQSVSGSRLIYGNYVEGFPNLGDPDGIDGFSGEKPNVAISVTYSDEPTGNETLYYGPLYYDGTSSSQATTTSGSGPTLITPWVTITSGTNTVTPDVNDGPNIYIADGLTSSYDAPNTFSFNFEIPVTSSFHLFDVGTSGNKFVSVTANGDTIDIDSLSEVIIDQASFFAEKTIDDTETITQIVSDLNFQLESQSFQRDFIDVPVTVGTTDYEITGVYTVLPKLFVIDSDVLSFRFVIKSVSVTTVKEITGSGPLDFEVHPITSQTSGLGLVGLYLGSWGVSTTSVGNWPHENRSFTVESIAVSSSFTGGSNHSFAFAYIDKYGRYGSAQEVGSVYVHPVGSPERVVSSSLKNGRASITLSPNHNPPDWASRYAVLYAGPDDIDDLHDIYVDDATKVVQETKFFGGKKPTSVFLDISSYVSNLREDGIEFSSVYSRQDGDVFRVISRRTHTINGSYTAGPGTGPTNLHSLSTTTEYFKDFTGDSALGNDGETVDLPIISVLEISENTSKEDYPFALPISGVVKGGVFLELDVDPSNTVWGSSSITTIREHILQGSDPYPTFADQITDNNGYDADNSYTNPRVDHNTVWKEFFTDGDYTQNHRKPLHRDSDWDKGIRGQIISPKKRTAARVYHEIGVFETMTDRSGSGSPHGTPVTLFDGYSWIRRIHSNDPFGSREQVGITPYMADPGWAETDYYDAGVGYLDQTRVDEINLYEGGRVRPVADEDNPICESFYTFAGSSEKIRNIGRLNVVSAEGERRRPSSLIHSQPYGSETLYNSLQEFFSVDFKDLDINNGAINAISPADQYLMVFQNSKVSRVPVNRNIFQTAAGQTSLSLTNQVLGAEQSFSGDYGVSTNGSAVINVDGVVYFIDKSRRSIIKISQSGFAPINTIDISEKIEKTFKDSEASNKNYALGFDREANYVYFTFQADSPFTGETYGYDHIKSAWTSRYSMIPNSYARCENDLLSFKYTDSGICHRHNNDSQRCNFYGTNEKSHVTVVSTAKNPSSIKVYNALGVECNAHKTVDARPNVTISNSVDQSVTLSWNKFSEKEGRIYAEIPSDGSNLQQAQKTADLTVTTTTWNGHIVPLGVVDSLDSNRFNLKSKVDAPVPKNLNTSLVWFNGSVWVSILSPHIFGTSADVTDGFINGSNITGSGVANGKTYIESSGFFGTYDSYIPANGTPVGSMLGYIVTDPDDVSDTTYSGTEINQPYGGKKVRDYYANITVESRANGQPFELYAVTVDVDESKIHM